MPEIKYAIFRILGNSLPPRHSVESTIKITEYILASEVRFPDSKRIWILNKIASASESSKLVDLLKEHGEHFVELKFDVKAHYHEFLDVTGIPVSLRFPARGILLPDGLSTHIDEWRLRHKSQKLIGINRARNIALEHGRMISTWSLILDGGVMFTPGGWFDFVESVSKNPDKKIAIIKMARVEHWKDISDEAQVFDAEPQMAFRNDSTEMFDEALRYGNLNKAELLNRLGVEGRWQAWTLASWDEDSGLPAPNANKFFYAGSVIRLPAEGTANEDSKQRFTNRFSGVEAYSLQVDLDYALRGRVPDKEYSELLHVSASQKSCRSLEQFSKSLLYQRDRFVIHKKMMPPSGDIHDYYTLPPNRSDTGRHYDGLRSSEPTELQQFKCFDRDSLFSFTRRTYTLAIAGRMQEKPKMLQKAANLLRGWLIKPETKLNPSARFSQYYPERGGINNVGIIEFRELSFLPYAIYLLRAEGVVSDSEVSLMKSWFREFLKDCAENGIERASLSRRNNIGTWAAVLFGTLRLFCDDYGDAYFLARDASRRLGQQLGPFSVQILEVERANPLHYALFNLAAWWSMARFCREFSIELMNFRGVAAESLQSALLFCKSNKAQFSDYKEDTEKFDRWIDLLLQLYQLAEFRDTVLCVEDFDWGIPPVILRRAPV